MAGRAGPSSAQPQVHIPTVQELIQYLPLYKATLKGNLDAALGFLDQYPEAITAAITRTSETVLHVAVGTGKEIHFVEKLLEILPPEALAQRDQLGHTALHKAAGVGNIEAAKLLVTKNQDLPNIWDNDRSPPLHTAAVVGHKEMILYLLTVTKANANLNPFEDGLGVVLMVNLITCGLYDIALDVLLDHPKLAWKDPCPLNVIAQMPSAFPSGMRLNFWQNRIYSCIPLKLDKLRKHSNIGDMESQEDSTRCVHIKKIWSQFLGGTYLISLGQKLHEVIWAAMEILAPQVKQIREMKLMHRQAQQLVRCFCREIIDIDNSNASSILHQVFLVAAEYGIHEITEAIVDLFPDAVSFLRDRVYTAFHLAVMNRHENVFNLIYQTTESRHFVSNIFDSSRNNILHLAGNLAPQHRLNLVSGATLQMQREVQWFKEVEKFVIPAYKQLKNLEGKTPAMIFTESHSDLVKEGERWMKDTANSCTVAAALIATVVFAAAITVPGGNSGDNGLPIFTANRVFILFAVSDAFSLFSSTAAVLMFLSILTSRYAEDDFLYSLPNRLIIGLIALFISITTMMIAFSAILYLVFGHNKAWILIPVAALACLPVSLFVSLQFPLLLDMIKSTYGRGIFGKRSERVLM